MTPELQPEQVIDACDSAIIALHICGSNANLRAVHRHPDLPMALYVYANDPPHFHVCTPGADAMVSIDALQVLVGKVWPADLAAALAWAAISEIVS